MTIALGASERIANSRDLLSGTSRAHAIDRWIYVCTAIFLVAIVLVGFVPDSISKVTLVEAGKRPPFPLILHIHAMLMGSFLLLLLAQTVFVATDRRSLHMQLGIVGFFLIPAIIVSGLILAPTFYHSVWADVQTAPASARQQFQPMLSFIDNVLLFQIRGGFLFAVYAWIALSSRVRNPGLHKRLMLLSITVVLGAAFGRIVWLPWSNVYIQDLYSILPFVPMFAGDLMRNRKVHPAYLIWAAWYLPATAVYYALVDTPWWHATARHIMGV